MPIDSVGSSNGWDLNDLTSTTQPFMRVIDAFDVNDVALRIVRSGGVTSSLVLPGSSNVMGGQAVVIKMKNSILPQDLLFPNTTKFLKFAIGQNPIRNGQRLNRAPQSRVNLIFF